jgi:hypothetical protein
MPKNTLSLRHVNGNLEWSWDDFPFKAGTLAYVRIAGQEYPIVTSPRVGTFIEDGKQVTVQSMDLFVKMNVVGIKPVQSLSLAVHPDIRGVIEAVKFVGDETWSDEDG